MLKVLFLELILNIFLVSYKTKAYDLVQPLLWNTILQKMLNIGF